MIKVKVNMNKIWPRFFENYIGSLRDQYRIEVMDSNALLTVKRVVDEFTKDGVDIEGDFNVSSTIFLVFKDEQSHNWFMLKWQ